MLLEVLREKGKRVSIVKFEKEVRLRKNRDTTYSTSKVTVWDPSFSLFVKGFVETISDFALLDGGFVLGSLRVCAVNFDV